MEFIRRLNWFTRTVLSIGTILLIYGYFCRIVGLYFFWESKSIGWAFICIGIITFLQGNIKYKRLNDKNSVAEKIGIAVFSFILLVQSVLIIFIANSNAYNTAKSYIKNNESLKTEIGAIKAITIIPFGGMSVSSSQSGETGQGNIYVTVKGSKKYKDLNLFVIKDLDTDWKILINE